MIKNVMLKVGLSYVACLADSYSGGLGSEFKREEFNLIKRSWGASLYHTDYDDAPRQHKRTMGNNLHKAWCDLLIKNTMRYHR